MPKWFAASLLHISNLAWLNSPMALPPTSRHGGHNAVTPLRAETETEKQKVVKKGNHTSQAGNSVSAVCSLFRGMIRTCRSGLRIGTCFLLSFIWHESHIALGTPLSKNIETSLRTAPALLSASSDFVHGSYTSIFLSRDR